MCVRPVVSQKRALHTRVKVGGEEGVLEGHSTLT